MKKSVLTPMPKAQVLFVFALIIPVLLFAQTDVEAAFVQNASLVESFSLLSPVAISPFWTLFITSFASTLGIGNDYIVSNPLLDNVIVLCISFILVLITTIPNLTKISKPLGLAAKFLENKAGYVIYVLVVIAPYIFTMKGSSLQGTLSIGIFDIPFSVILMLGLALPYFFVVVTVRYFLEILIFLSPIPLLDAFFELAKKGFTFFLMFVYFVFPTFGFILSILIFLTAFYYFKRARKASNFFQYIYVFPILAKILRRKQALVSEKAPARIKKKFPQATLMLRCLSGTKMGSVPSKAKAWLIKSGEDVFIYQPKFLMPPNVFEISSPLTEDLQISQELYYRIIHDEQSQVKILLNSTYKSLSEEIIAELNLEDMGKVGLAKKKEILSQQSKKGWQRLLSVFNSKQISAGRDAILEE